MASNKKQVILITSLIVLLVLALGYIGFGIYSQAQAQKELNVFQQGVQTAIVQIAELASSPNCQQVPLIVGDKTINIIAVECYPELFGLAPAQTEETQ